MDSHVSYEQRENDKTRRYREYWAYTSMELGRRKRLPDPETIERLAQSLGVTVSELVESAGYKCGAGHVDA